MIRNSFVAILSVLMLANCAGTPENSLFRKPMVGIIQDGSVPVLIKTTGDGDLRIEYKKQSESQSRFTGPASVSASNEHTVNLILNNLEASTPYLYRVEFNKQKFSEWFHFKTFPAEGRPGKFSFIFGSGMREKWATPDVYKNIQDTSPTFVALMGDQMYADYDGNVNTLEKYLANDSLRQKRIDAGKKVLSETSVIDAFRGKYQRAFIETFQDMGSSIPVMGIWDDHDMGKNNNDGTYPYKAIAKTVFKEVYPSYPFEVEDGGLYYQFSIADVDAFVLDARWYRSPMEQADGPDKKMLGDQQMQWLLNGLKQSTAKFKIIFSSVPFNDYGGDTSKGKPGAFDSWMGYKYAREYLLSFIREEKIKGVVVFGADQHYPSAHILNWDMPLEAVAQTDTSITYSLSQLNQALFDFSAGPFNNRRATGHPLIPENQANPRFSYEVYRPEWAKPENESIYKPFKTGVSVYGLAEINTESSPATITVKFYEMDKTSKEMVELYRIDLIE